MAESEDTTSKVPFKKAKNTALTDSLEKALGVKRSTARVYSSAIASLSRKVNESTDDIHWLTKKKILKHVADINNLTRRKNLASAIVAGLKLLQDKRMIEKYREILMKADKDYSAYLQSGKRKRPYKDADATWTRIKGLWKKASAVVSAQKLYEKGESINASDYRTLITLVYLKFISDMPIRRLEYAETRFVDREPPEKGNYIICHKKKPWEWSISHYKTFSRYGKQRFVISSGLKKILKRLRPIVKAKDVNEHIFLNSRWSKMSRDVFSKFVSKIFQTYMGKAFTQNTIRSIRVSSVWKDSVKTIEALQLAESMGHDVRTAMETYRDN